MRICILIAVSLLKASNRSAKGHEDLPPETQEERARRCALNYDTMATLRIPPPIPEAHCVMRLLRKIYAPPPPDSGVPGLDAIYIIHEKKFVDRRPILEQALAENGMRALFITWLSKADITQEIEKCFFMADYISKTKNALQRKGGTGRLANNLKFFWAFFEQLRRSQKNVLMLEDDAVLVDGFRSKIVELLAQVPPTYLSITVGDCKAQAILRRDIREKTCSGTFPSGATLLGPGLGPRCSTGVLMSNRGAQRLFYFSFTKRRCGNVTYRALSTVGSPVCDKIHDPADLILHTLNRGNFWMSPAFAVQNQSLRRCYGKLMQDPKGACRPPLKSVRSKTPPIETQTSAR